MRLFPQLSGRLQNVDFLLLPPVDFVAGLVQLPVMSAAEGDGELVADFHADGAGLGEAQVVGVGWLPAADETGLGRHKPQVSPVSYSLWFT